MARVEGVGEVGSLALRDAKVEGESGQAAARLGVDPATVDDLLDLDWHGGLARDARRA